MATVDQSSIADWLPHERVSSRAYLGAHKPLYPAEIISCAVWLYFRFPLSLRMVEEMLCPRHRGDA
jgi:hypothetical protein